jgi:RiboL-PSP-HEPN
MRFLALDSQIEKCDLHLRVTGTSGTEIEYYFTQLLLVRICAEFEGRIRVLIERRCSRPNDVHIKAFVQKSARVVCRDFSIGDIKGHLARFGDDYAKNFRDLMDDELIAIWGNIYTNRHAVAHGAGSQMSLPELKIHYAKAKDVLEAVVLALALRPRELKNL